MYTSIVYLTTLHTLLLDCKLGLLLVVLCNKLLSTIFINILPQLNFAAIQA